MLSLLNACALQHYQPATLDQTMVPATQAVARLDSAAQGEFLDRLGAITQWPLAQWNAAQLGLLAVARSRTVTAAQAALTSATAQRAAAGQRANPTVALNLEHHSDASHGQDGHWSVGPSVDFSLSPISRRRLAVALADAEIERMRAQVAEAAWSARMLAIDAADELLAQRALVPLNAASIDARAAVIAAARAEVAAGVADSFEWQTLQIEATSARLNQLDAVTASAAAGAALASALNLPVSAIADIVIDSPAKIAVPAYAELQQRMLTTHPQVLTALADYAKAEHDLALAIAAQYPEIHLSPGYFFDQGDNVWSLLGGIVVPVFATQAAAIKAATAARDQARDQFYAVQASTIATLQTAYANWTAGVTAQAAAATIAAESANTRRTLATKHADGVVSQLVLARADLQQHEIDTRVATVNARVQQQLSALEFAARTPLADPAFAKFLPELVALPADSAP